MSLLLKTEHLIKKYHHGSKVVIAVDDVSFELQANNSLGIVGESGSGKSTLGKLLLGLIKPTSGDVTLLNKPLTQISQQSKSRMIQMIPQDWQSSFNPKWNIRETLSEGWLIHNIFNLAEINGALLELMQSFNLKPDLLNRKPRELSGGQLQRVAIARALSLKPQVLIADEPTSSLDIPLRNQILDFLKKTIEERHTTLIIISHDIEAVQSITSNIMIMYKGKVVEVFSENMSIKDAIHPYTHRLLNPNKTFNDNQNWDSLNENFRWDAKCPFTGVCSQASEVCHTQSPPWRNHENSHSVLCHH